MSSSSSGASTDVNQQVAQILAGYGGSDDTRGDFNRPRYNRYNAISKSRDFGSLDNLVAVVTGTIGGQSGASTLYFKVTLNGPADLRIRKLNTNPREDQFISVGILGPDHKPLPLDADGFASSGSDWHSSSDDESSQPLAAGTYWFTVSSNRWQQLNYSAALIVLRYRELSGAVEGSAELVGRIALVKLRGAASATAPLTGTVVRSSKVKRLSGQTLGRALPVLQLVIPAGVISAAAPLEGRLKATWRVEGSAGGTLSAAATLTTSGGGGYGY